VEGQDFELEKLLIAEAIRLTLHGFDLVVRSLQRPRREGRLIQNRKRKPDILLSDSRTKNSVENPNYKAEGDSKYKKVLERVPTSDLTKFEEVLRVGIQSNDWNQLYVYMRITEAMRGFFLVPFWSAEGPSTVLLDDFDFVDSPCDGNVRLAVLGLNLLRQSATGRQRTAR
jgi:hypothetical protein